MIRSRLYYYVQKGVKNSTLINVCTGFKNVKERNLNPTGTLNELATPFSLHCTQDMDSEFSETF